MRVDCNEFISLAAPIIHPSLDPHPIHHEILQCLPLWAGLLPAGYGHIIYWHVVISGSFLKFQIQSSPSFCPLKLDLDIRVWSATQASVGSGGKRNVLWAVSNGGCRGEIDTSSLVPILHQQWLSFILLFNSLRQIYFATAKKKKRYSSQDHLVSRILKFTCYFFQNKNLGHLILINNLFLSWAWLHLQILSF